MRRAAILFLAALLLASCRSIPRESSSSDHATHDTMYINRHSSDSIYMHDSTFVFSTDTLRTIERWHTEYRYIVRQDTVMQSRVDTLVQSVQTVVRERYTPSAVKWLAVAGAIVIAGAVAFGAFRIWRLFR